MDARTRAMLAKASPQNWDEARRRIAVVRRYLADTDRSAAKVEAYLKEAGMTRSIFYRMARLYEQQSKAVAELEPRGEVAPLRELVSKAIDRTGTATSIAQIYRAVVALSRARGITPPSYIAVRAHVATLLAGSSIAARMGLNAELAIDRALLDLKIGSGPDHGETAQLVCIVNIAKGTIVRHMLSAGEPSLDELASFLRSNEIVADRIAVSESDAVLHGPTLRSALRDQGSVLLSGRWQMGTAIRAVTGLRIGRLTLLARPPRRTKLRASVQLETAMEVIGELLRPFEDATSDE